jgi:GNAT superfamily N-acetyltransferase
MSGSADGLERAELAAMADVARAAPPEVAEAQGIALLEPGAAVALSVRTLSGARMFNHALGVADEAQLDALEAFYAAQGCAFFVSTAPGAALDGPLERRGYRRDYAWMKFRRGVEPLDASTDLRVEAVGAEHGEAVGRIIATAYEAPPWLAVWVAAVPGRPGWSFHLAFDGDEPVAAGALHVAGAAGWLGFGATLPSHRGRGAQGALLAARIAEAARRGCATVVTETGERTEDRPSASYRNILRAGFEEAYLRANWASPAPG